MPGPTRCPDSVTLGGDQAGFFSHLPFTTASPSLHLGAAALALCAAGLAAGLADSVGVVEPAAGVVAAKALPASIARVRAVSIFFMESSSGRGRNYRC